MQWPGAGQYRAQVKINQGRCLGLIWTLGKLWRYKVFSACFWQCVHKIFERLCTTLRSYINEIVHRGFVLQLQRVLHFTFSWYEMVWPVHNSSLPSCPVLLLFNHLLFMPLRWAQSDWFMLACSKKITWLSLSKSSDEFPLPMVVGALAAWTSPLPPCRTSPSNVPSAKQSDLPLSPAASGPAQSPVVSASSQQCRVSYAGPQLDQLNQI